MTTSEQKYGANPQHFRDLLVAPVTAIDTQIQTNYFSYEETDDFGIPTGVILYHSVASHEIANNRKIKYTADGLYFYYGLDTSDLDNDTKDMKNFIKTAGLVLGGADFTAMVGNEFWVLSASELDEWLNVSPHEVMV